MARNLTIDELVTELDRLHAASNMMRAMAAKESEAMVTACDEYCGMLAQIMGILQLHRTAEKTIRELREELAIEKASKKRVLHLPTAFIYTLSDTDTGVKVYPHATLVVALNAAGIAYSETP